MVYPNCLISPTAENTYCGASVSQTWNDLALWEAFLDAHQVGSILELGTWRGGMALFLAHQGQARNLKVMSIDHGHGGLDRPDLLVAAGCQLIAMDLLNSGAPAIMAHLLATLPKPTLLLCDNGHKKSEWKAFVPLLSPGDFAAVHDWQTEFFETDLDPLLPMLFSDECDQVQSMTRFFAVP